MDIKIIETELDEILNGCADAARNLDVEDTETEYFKRESLGLCVRIEEVKPLILGLIKKYLEK